MEIEEIITELEETGNIRGYQYFSLLKERSILFNDECSKNIVETVGIPLLRFDKDSSTEPVHLYISSEGGDVFTSLFICNIIDNYSKPLYIHVLGYGLSMGFLLSCAGKNNPNVHKDCYPFSIFMLHSGSLTVSGDTNKAKSFMKFNESLEEKEKTYVLSHTTIDEDTYDKFVDNDYWLTAEQAYQYGIVDEIIGVAKDEK